MTTCVSEIKDIRNKNGVENVVDVNVTEYEDDFVWFRGFIDYEEIKQGKNQFNQIALLVKKANRCDIKKYRHFLTRISVDLAVWIRHSVNPRGIIFQPNRRVRLKMWLNARSLLVPVSPTHGYQFQKLVPVVLHWPSTGAFRACSFPDAYQIPGWITCTSGLYTRKQISCITSALVGQAYTSCSVFLALTCGLYPLSVFPNPSNRRPASRELISLNLRKCFRPWCNAIFLPPQAAFSAKQSNKPNFRTEENGGIFVEFDMCCDGKAKVSNARSGKVPVCFSFHF